MGRKGREDRWFGVEPRRGRLSDPTSQNDNYQLSGPDFAPARPWASQWRSPGAECFIGGTPTLDSRGKLVDQPYRFLLVQLGAALDV